MALSEFRADMVRISRTRTTDEDNGPPPNKTYSNPDRSCYLPITHAFHCPALVGPRSRRLAVARLFAFVAVQAEASPGRANGDAPNRNHHDRQPRVIVRPDRQRLPHDACGR